MHRRDFIKALSAFVAVATVAPKTLAHQPVDWAEWNDIELLCERDGIKRFLVNEKDYTYSREAREKLAQMLHFDDSAVTIGDCRNDQRWGVQVQISEWLPAKFKIGFQVKFNTNTPTSYATNGKAVSDVWMLS